MSHSCILLKQLSYICSLAKFGSGIHRAIRPEQRYGCYGQLAREAGRHQQRELGLARESKAKLCVSSRLVVSNVMSAR